MGSRLLCPFCHSTFYGQRRGPGFPGRDGNRARAQLPALTGPCLVLREQQEREKALRLQRERLQRELEEKKKKVQGSQGCGARPGSALSLGLGSPDMGAPGAGTALLGRMRLAWGRAEGHAHGP